MFATRGWMRLALFLNLLGAALLFFSFQATSSNFILITGSDGTSALCVNGKSLVAELPGHGWRIGGAPCPELEHGRPTAVVNSEHPFFVTLGFIITIIGFALQFLAIPGPRSIAAMRKELREARLQERIAGHKKSN